MNAIQVKICGLTRVDEALAAAELGAAAIGLVFYPPSPRFVSDTTAQEIGTSLPDRVARVGVFVDESYDEIMRKAVLCRLSAVQLHGLESPELVEALGKQGLTTIKSVFQKKKPPVSDAHRYGASACLVEGGAGPLPGGNAETWEWASVRKMLGELPCVLAGGLNPDNVAKAIAEFCPVAVDVSSGVEAAPGRKDMEKIRLFMEAVRGAELRREPRRIFV